MIQDSSPITPPPELVQQWFLSARAMPVDQWVTDVATQAAHWGADQELEACCEWFFKNYAVPSGQLRAIRRPKPPSLKEQALQALDLLKVDASTHGLGFDSSAIRRALESMPD